MVASRSVMHQALLLGQQGPSTCSSRDDKKLQTMICQYEGQIARLTSKLASTELELEESTARCEELGNALQSAQALRFTNNNVFQERSAADVSLIASLHHENAELRARLTALQELRDDRNTIWQWLDSIKAGYGMQFADAFRNAGYQDLLDVSGIPSSCLPREWDLILPHLDRLGAKAPQKRLISEALTALIHQPKSTHYEAWTPKDSASGGELVASQANTGGSACPAAEALENASVCARSGADPKPELLPPAFVSISDWLETVGTGYGSRFTKWFTASGYEDVSDLLKDSTMCRVWPPQEQTQIFFRLKAACATASELRQVQQAIDTLIDEEQVRRAMAASVAEL